MAERLKFADTCISSRRSDKELKIQQDSWGHRPGSLSPRGTGLYPHASDTAVLWGCRACPVKLQAKDIPCELVSLHLARELGEEGTTLSL